MPGQRIRPADRETRTSLIASFGDDMVAPSALDNQTTQTEMISSDYFLLTHFKKKENQFRIGERRNSLWHTLGKEFPFFFSEEVKKGAE